MKSGEPIGIDAALIYGIPDYQGDITAKHLHDPKNRYNTRIFKGLPPTPIGSPSQSALTAVLAPSAEGYRFFVAKADGSGRHHFTSNLTDHNRYVHELVKATKRKPGGVTSSSAKKQ